MNSSFDMIMMEKGKRIRNYKEKTLADKKNILEALKNDSIILDHILSPNYEKVVFKYKKNKNPNFNKRYQNKIRYLRDFEIYDYYMKKHSINLGTYESIQKFNQNKFMVFMNSRKYLNLIFGLIFLFVISLLGTATLIHLNLEKIIILITLIVFYNIILYPIFILFSKFNKNNTVIILFFKLLFFTFLIFLFLYLIFFVMCFKIQNLFYPFVFSYFVLNFDLFFLFLYKKVESIKSHRLSLINPDKFDFYKEIIIGKDEDDFMIL